MTRLSTRPSFGQLLKRWRERRGIAQLRLAVEAGTSQRHLSFLETGRATPSREMVLRLARNLGVPLRDQNGLLLAAGYAPAFEQRPFDAPRLKLVRDAAKRVLANHEPFPAVVLDRERNVLSGNRGARVLGSGAARALLEPPVNLLRLLLSPDGLAPRIVDFGRYSGLLLERLRREVEYTQDERLERLLAEVSSYPGVDEQGAPVAPDQGELALTLRVRREDGKGELAFISTLATVGAPMDVSVSELVIECLFPADSETARYFLPPGRARRRAGRGRSR